MFKPRVSVRILKTFLNDYETGTSFDWHDAIIECVRALGMDTYDDAQQPEELRKDMVHNGTKRILDVLGSPSMTGWRLTAVNPTWDNGERWRDDFVGVVFRIEKPEVQDVIYLGVGQIEPS